MRLSAEKRLIYATCLFKESVFLRKSKLPLYQKLEVPESCSTLHQFWIIASCPSICCSCRKNLSHAKNWTIAVIEFLATVGWKWGCQPFSCPCSLNVMQCRKEIYATCLFKESMFLWNSTRSLRSLRAAVCLHHADPFIAAARKLCLMSRSCGLQDLLRNIPTSDVSMWQLQNTE